MGMGFRLDWKWGFPVQSPLRTNVSARQKFFSVRGRDPSFESASVSIMSVIPDESDMSYRDPLKSYTCSFAALQTVENGYAEMDEMKMKIGKEFQNASYNTIDDSSMPSPGDTSTYRASLQESKTSRFSLLLENIEKIEEIFDNSDLVRLEGDILLQLEKLGALKLFHACLSRTIRAQTLHNLPIAPTKLSKDHLMDGIMDDYAGYITVHSRKKEERKSRRLRASRKATMISALPSSSKTVRRGQRQSTVSTVKNPPNSRSRRLLIARNESEMSRGVKEVANLERIMASLEEEIGQVASFSRWAEAAGVDEKVLQQRLHFGWFCRDKLIRSTRSLVVYLARNYRGLGIAFEDLLQAGNIGVLQGAERFDHTRGYRFSTYVQYWIRKSMLTMVARNARGIKIPLTLSRAITQIQKARKALYKSHGRYPDDEEIAKFTGLSLAKIRMASKCLRIVGSIDQKMGNSLGIKFMEFTSGTFSKTPEETVMRQHMRKDIHELLQGLQPRERQVLMLRFGLWDGQCKSLEEIGRLFHVTKEWIRKIERAALTNVRKEEIRKNLSQYLEL